MSEEKFTRIPWRGKPEAQYPDSPRYKACGDSMCVVVIGWLGRIVEREINHD